MMTGRKWLIGCLCLAVLVSSSSGCVPLRKKFTRQKKKDHESKEIIPVLEPIDYPAKHHGAKEEYAQHYSLCRVWLSDFDMSRDLQMNNEKKLVLNLDAALKEVGEMDQVVSGAGKDQLAKIRVQLQFVRNEYDKPKSFRNETRISNELRSIDKALRAIKPDMVSFNTP